VCLWSIYCKLYIWKWPESNQQAFCVPNQPSVDRTQYRQWQNKDVWYSANHACQIMMFHTKFSFTVPSHTNNETTLSCHRVANPNCLKFFRTVPNLDAVSCVQNGSVQDRLMSWIFIAQKLWKRILISGFHLCFAETWKRALKHILTSNSFIG